MPRHHAYDETVWQLRRIRQLWSELRNAKAETPRYVELVARIRSEAEAYTRGISSNNPTRTSDGVANDADARGAPYVIGVRPLG